MLHTVLLQTVRHDLGETYEKKRSLKKKECVRIKMCDVAVLLEGILYPLVLKFYESQIKRGNHIRG